jgi:putative transposase
MLPRQVLPRQCYLITRRCTQRQFLLRPDAATNNAFLYCLIAAAQRCEIDVLLPCAMSNHHLVIYDRAGRYPEFIEHFHKLVARSQNALRGRWENFGRPIRAKPAS